MWACHPLQGLLRASQHHSQVLRHLSQGPGHVVCWWPGAAHGDSHWRIPAAWQMIRIHIPKYVNYSTCFSFSFDSGSYQKLSLHLNVIFWKILHISQPFFFSFWQWHFIVEAYFIEYSSFWVYLITCFVMIGVRLSVLGMKMHRWHFVPMPHNTRGTWCRFVPLVVISLTGFRRCLPDPPNVTPSHSLCEEEAVCGVILWECVNILLFNNLSPGSL